MKAEGGLETVNPASVTTIIIAGGPGCRDAPFDDTLRNHLVEHLGGCISCEILPDLRNHTMGPQRE